MGHTLQLYILHRMKALPKNPRLAGLDNFFRCGAFSLWRGRPRPRELLGGAALPALRFSVCDQPLYLTLVIPNRLQP